MEFLWSYVNKAKITDNGTVQSMVFGCVNTDSTLIDSSIGNVKFPATQVASSDANTLDDYQEGTFTPVFADATSGGNTGTPASTFGKYTKIGDCVLFTITLSNIDTTGMTGGNTAYIRDLPVNVSSSGNMFASVQVDQTAISGDYIVARANANTDYITLRMVTAAGDSADMTVSNFTDDTCDISITGHYFV